MVRWVHEAWDDWSRKVAPVFPQPHLRNQAVSVSNGFFCRAKPGFDANPRVTLVEECERLLIVFDDLFVVRFKLLDSQWRTQNYPTAASKRMDAQQEIDVEGVGKLPRVVFGYRVGGTPTKLRDLWVLFAVDREPLWKYDAEGDDRQRALPFPQPAVPPAAASRFRKKGEPEKTAEPEQAADDA
jgi:hypothetical protein